jgi:glycosyltransferase involved in cell wall biosynthesis/GT2 family glycosyltransferase
MPTWSRSTPAHVVIVTPELWGLTSENGGISTSVFHFARLFSERGDRVTILCGLAKDASISEPWAGRYREAGIDVHVAVAAQHRRRTSPALEFPFAAISVAVADALPGDVDVVYYQDWCALGYEPLRRRMFHGSDRFVSVTVLRGASAWARADWAIETTQDPSDRALAQAERLAIERSPFVVAPSYSYRKAVAEHGVRLPDKGRTRVLGHPWLPLGNFVPPAAARSATFRRLVYFGRLETRKGLDLLLDALVEVDRTSDCLSALEEIVFLGPQGRHGRESLDSIAGEVGRYGLGIRFVTDLDSWQACELLTELAPDSLAVLPSLRENFPNAVIEVSLVPGLNAIFSDVGGVSEIVGERGRKQLFAPDARSLAAALATRLHHAPQKSAELASYDWRSANARWLEFHDQLLAAAIPSSAPRRRGRTAWERGAKPSRLGLFVSTYKRPEALDAVVQSLADQFDRNFDLIVADDGSGAETRAVVDGWRPTFGDRLAHIWQADEGFRRARILDLAVMSSRADYLVFLDGDGLARPHFVQALRSAAHPGWFVAGKRIGLSDALTARVLNERLPVHRWSFGRWLLATRHAEPLVALTSRDRRKVGALRVPEFAPMSREYGFLLGVSRTDFERVDGFDTRFTGWGEEDVDIAVRLRRIGLRCGHAGPNATLIHLWHPSVGVDDRPNWHLLKETERSDRIEAIEGMSRLAGDVVHAT